MNTTIHITQNLDGGLIFRSRGVDGVLKTDGTVMNYGTKFRRKNMSTSDKKWIKRKNEDANSWDNIIASGTYGYVHQYEKQNSFNWQTHRPTGCLSGIVSSKEEAMNKSDEALLMPIEDFNTIVVTELMGELKDIESQVLKIQPTAKLIPGYQAGYAKGIEDNKRSICETMNVTFHPQS